MYQDQLHRIQEKLAQAKAADKDLEVFGASSHKYHLNPPVSEAEVLAFEKKYKPLKTSLLFPCRKPKAC